MRTDKRSLEGQVALITGAAHRIGRTTAAALAREGVNIVAHYNTSPDEAQRLVDELKEYGVKGWTIQANFSKPDEYNSLVDRTLDLVGSFDILVNNASIFPASNLDNLVLDEVMASAEVNAWSPFVLSRSFAERVGKGKIINLLDTRIKGYDWWHVGYILSKHMLAVLTSMLALKYAPDITVNAVAPGLILPPPGKDQSYLDRLKDTVPLKRHGDPEDIADTIVFLAKSRFITGEVIYVDGGRHLKEYIDG